MVTRGDTERKMRIFLGDLRPSGLQTPRLSHVGLNSCQREASPQVLPPLPKPPAGFVKHDTLPLCLRREDMQEWVQLEGCGVRRNPQTQPRPGGQQEQSLAQELVGAANGDVHGPKPAAGAAAQVSPVSTFW